MACQAVCQALFRVSILAETLCRLLCKSELACDGGGHLSSRASSLLPVEVASAMFRLKLIAHFYTLVIQLKALSLDSKAPILPFPH
jgi:hypothetical protein